MSCASRASFVFVLFFGLRTRYVRTEDEITQGAHRRRGKSEPRASITVENGNEFAFFAPFAASDPLGGRDGRYKFFRCSCHPERNYSSLSHFSTSHESLLTIREKPVTGKWVANGEKGTLFSERRSNRRFLSHPQRPEEIKSFSARLQIRTESMARYAGATRQNLSDVTTRFVFVRSRYALQGLASLCRSLIHLSREGEGGKLSGMPT